MSARKNPQVTEHRLFSQHAFSCNPMPFRLTNVCVACALAVFFSTVSSRSYALDGNDNNGQVEIVAGTSVVDEDVYGYLSFDGDARGGLVTIENSQVSLSGSKALYGAYSEGGDASSNTVIITESQINKKGGSPDKAYVTGGYSETGNADSNTVTIKNSTLTRIADSSEGVVGGISNEGNAVGNTVTVSESAVTGNITGGQAQTQADNNIIEINNSAVVGSIYGGWGNQSASSNRVNIIASDGKSYSFGDIYGGFGIRSACGNVVNIDITGSTGDIYGGNANWGQANSNQVFILGQTVVDEAVVGGFAISENNSDISVENNFVDIRGNASIKAVAGGHAIKGIAQGNTVSISENAVITGVVYGAEADQNSALSNTVQIGGKAQVKGTIFGGYSEYYSADNNLVLIQDDATAYSPNIYGGFGGLSASNNKVQITGGSIVTDIVSGAAVTSVESNVVLTGNSVQIDAGEVIGRVYGAFGGGTVSQNQVVITGGQVKETRIAGGYGLTGATVEGNLVAILGGDIEGTVYGGYAWSGNVFNNTVLLSSAVDLTKAHIYGGYNDVRSVEVSSNKLIIADSGVVTQSINNFDSIDLTVTELDKAALTLTNQGNGLGEVDLTVHFNLAVTGSQAPLEQGTTITLIDSGDVPLSITDIKTEGALVGLQGVSLLHQFALSDDGTQATLVGSSINPSTSVLGTGQIAMLGFLTQANHLATDIGLARAHDIAQSRGQGLYAAASGANLRMDNNNGSQTELDGLNWLMGAVNRVNLSEADHLDLHLYFEAGTGDAESRKRGLKGSTDATYYGVGALVRHEQTAGALKGFYTQLNAQAGRASIDFDANLFDGNGTKASYDNDSTYYGVGAALGYRFDAFDVMTVDLSASYQWLKLNGFSDCVASDSYRFGDMTSQRALLQLKAAYTGAGSVQPYAKVAWEHEFEAETDIKTYGMKLDELSLKGDTATAEIGARYAPAGQAWTIEGAVKGFVGQNEGFAGHAVFNWQF